MDNNNNDVGIKSDECKIESPIKASLRDTPFVKSFDFSSSFAISGLKQLLQKTISMSLVEGVEVLKK